MTILKLLINLCYYTCLNQKFYFAIFFRGTVLLRYLIIFACGPMSSGNFSNLVCDCVWIWILCSIFFKKSIFIGVQLLYNVVLVSSVQKSDSSKHKYISPLFWTSFPFRLPQSIEQSSLCYIQQALKSWVSLKIENTLKKSRISHSFQRFVFSLFSPSSRITSNCFPLPSLGFGHPDLHSTCCLVVSFLSLLLLLSRFSRVRLCEPLDGSPPGSPVPGILQARTLEWGAIAFSFCL